MTVPAPLADYPEPVLIQGGDLALARHNTVLRVLVGSTLHGIGHVETEDRDEMGIMIEPPEYVFGFPGVEYLIEEGRSGFGQVETRTKPEGAPSEPGDLDLIIYSLRKYVRLALQGNPTILLPLFVPDSACIISTQLGRDLREYRDEIVSRRALARFLGYSERQREKMLGRKGDRRGRGGPTRRALASLHGYDPKFAAHAVRLAVQGIELAQTGRLTLPLQDPWRTRCLLIKDGEVELEQVLRWLDKGIEILQGYVANPATVAPELRAEPNLDFVNVWLKNAHQLWWAGKGR